MHWLVKVFSPPAAGRSQEELASDAKRKAEGSAWLAGCGFVQFSQPCLQSLRTHSTDRLLASMGRKDKWIILE